jgi:hypothetical protein
MMNIKEHLFLLLSEEASEVSQAASKCIRFTPSHELNGLSNSANLEIEYNDLLAVIDLLEDHGVFLRRVNHLVEAKKKRLAKFFKISEEFGTLEMS